MSSAVARRVLVAVAVAVMAGGFIGTGQAGSAAAPAPGSRYVALGDSYAAGYGIGTSTAKPVAGCSQSTQDYPHQIAAALHLNLTDVSCSGAVTANIDKTPQTTTDGTAPLQDAALTPATELVTVTIGGNDLGFADIAQYCLASSPAGPLVLHPPALNCKAHYAPTGGADSLAATVAGVVAPRVARVLADIHARAPRAHVYFIDYPAISTTKAASPNPTTYPDSCFSPVAVRNSFPFTGVDTAYLQGVQVKLNAALAAQVAKSGDTFVENYPQSLTHSACAGTADPWMNGVTLDTSGGAAPGSLHPNLTGATQLAAHLLAAIGPRATPTSTASTSSAATSTAASSPAHGAGSSTGPGNAAPTSTAVALASTGPSNTRGLTLGGLLLVLVGFGLLLAARRRSRPQQH